MSEYEHQCWPKLVNMANKESWKIITGEELEETPLATNKYVILPLAKKKTGRKKLTS